MDLVPHIAKTEERFKQAEAELAEFDFGAGEAGQRRYEALNREYQRLSALMGLWHAAEQARQDLAGTRELLDSEDDPDFLEEVNRDIERLEPQIASLDQQLKAALLPPHPYEERNLIMEIRPAAGGDEAGLFAADLLRMYTRFVESRNWKTEVLESSENDLGGIRSAVFSVQGASAYRFLGLESGVHRVQRIPVTESGGRIHTSTVTVAVLPEAEEVDLRIDPQDLRFDVFRSSGPGGQSVNTTDSAVRVTHVPSGLSIASQQEKSQHRNKEIALRILRSRLLEIHAQEAAAKNAAERRQQVGSGDRSERIRTYNFPQNRVTDHRFGVTRHDLGGVMEGQLDGLLAEIMAANAERRLAAELE